MIIARIPLRISFFGGGTDIPIFYKNCDHGCVLNTTINKFLYIILKDHGDLFNEKFRLNYSISETANNRKEIKNKIFKEILNFFKVKQRLYLSTISDVPSSSGLGSSSALVVGLFLLFNKKFKLQMKNHELIEKAAQFEINNISNYIGKQDHYASFYGGVNYFEFFKNEKVRRISVKNSEFIKKIEDNLIFFWTGIQRNANTILKKQNNNFTKNFNSLNQMRDITKEVFKKIEKKKINYKVFGEYLNKTWLLKRELSNVISDDYINKCYNVAMKNGAIGGKLLGAGGGGFLMILAPKSKHKKIIDSLKKYKLKFEKIGFYNGKPALINF